MKKILLVIEREFITRVKKKSFIIMTILVPVLFAVLMIVPTLLSSVKSEKEKKIAVVDDLGLVANDIKNSGTVKFIIETRPLDSLKNNLAKDDYYAVLHVENNEENSIKNIRIYSEQALSADILNNISFQIKSIATQIQLKAYDIKPEELLLILNPNINIKTIRIDELGTEKESHTGALMAVAMVCGILIFLVVFMFGIQIMRSVIEEKSSRIIEIIISSIKPVQLMLGKIIGVALVVITQLIIWAILITVIFFVAQSQFADVISKITGYVQDVPMGTMLVSFILYLIFGYLLYASLYAIVGSAVDNETDTQQLQMIGTLPIMIGYFIMINVAMQPDSPLAFWGSMIPFTSPLVMLARIPFGVPLWEIILSLTILAATFILFTWIAARIYRVGILMYGKKASLKEIIKWLKYKQ
ncbi:MAG: ABC transporter permease [Prevotellaceae bacterium]|jgi:ABC-2 type transport system permease protein|nr:ABC transporter permease [Prevotellaceae bacterium]